MKFGTIGSGYIVRAFLDGVYKNDGEVVAVYSRRQETGEALAKDYGSPQVYTDLEAMYNDENVEVVYVASPNSLHYAQSLKALQHGKHVVVEKPMCATVAQAKKLFEEAKERGLFIFEAITNQHLPNYKIIPEILGKIGRIRMVQCNYSQYSSRYDALKSGEEPNVFSPKFSGGALSDINIYNIHFVIGLFGLPKDVAYYVNRHANGIDLSGVAILTYPDFIATCVGAKDSASTNFAQIQGEDGYIYVRPGSNGCREVELHIKDKITIYNQQEDSNALYYENVDFKKIIGTKDYQARDAFMEESMKCMQVLNQARQFANLVFDEDTQPL